MAKILAVDDIEDNVFLLKMILEKHDHEVFSALSGKEALKIAETTAVDLVLLDLMMPEMDGMEVARLLKSREATRHVPIILLTAKKKEVADVVSGLDAGADEYLTKPFNETELMARVRSMLRMKSLFDQIDLANKHMEDDLVTAQKVQNALLPTQYPYSNQIKVTAYYEAASSLGGDYYDILDYGDGKIGAVVADVSGHGVSAALIMSMIKAIMAPHIDNDSGPEKIAKLLNKRLISIIPEERYCTLFFAIVDFNAGKFSYIRAGHPYPFLLRKENKSVVKLDAEGDVIGLFDDITIDQAEIKFNPGDRLFAYSDGLIEVIDSGGDLYGIDRLRKELESNFEKRGDDLMSHIIDTTKAFSANEANEDDVAVLIVEFL